NMKTIQALIRAVWCGSLSVTLSAVAAGDVKDTLHQSFPVEPGGKLVVEADRGSIEVKSADADQVEIDVFRKVSRESRSTAEEILKNHEVKFSKEGNQVQVHAKLRKEWRSAWKQKGNNLQVRYQISVPKTFNLELKTAGGSIKIPDLTGHARAQTAGGSLNFGQIEGPIYGRTSGGGIRVAACKGAVDVETAGGSITL